MTDDVLRLAYSKADNLKPAAAQAGNKGVGGEYKNIAKTVTGAGEEGAGKVAKYFGDVQLKTEPNKAYFWSGNSNGIGGKDYTMDYAARNGGTTLEGLMKSRGIEMPTWDISDPIAIKAWEDASATYASQVSGEVRALIGTNMRPNSVWQTIELPRLMKNPNVIKIIVIDPESLAETIIFWR